MNSSSNLKDTKQAPKTLFLLLESRLSFFLYHLTQLIYGNQIMQGFQRFKDLKLTSLFPVREQIKNHIKKSYSNSTL